MNDLFRPHLRRFVLVFFDDILVYSKTWEEHLDHLQTMLTILVYNTLYAKEVKCTFRVTQIEYLGHTISQHGVRADQGKIWEVREWPVSTTARDVRGFLDLTGYYRKFIRHFGGIAAPLTRLLTKELFIWTSSSSVMRVEPELEQCLPNTTGPLPTLVRPSKVRLSPSLLMRKKCWRL